MVSAPAQAANGNYTVSWSVVAGASSYELEEMVGAGNWTAVGATTMPNAMQYAGRPAGSYGYRSRGCDPAGCGPFSALVTVVAFSPPGSGPALSAPAIALNGNFALSWSSVPGANEYSVEESVNGAGWVVYSDLAGNGAVHLR